METQKLFEEQVKLHFVKRFVDDDGVYYFQLENDSVVAPELSIAWSEREWSDVMFHNENGITELALAAKA
jgi:hypothetical protein